MELVAPGSRLAKASDARAQSGSSPVRVRLSIRGVPRPFRPVISTAGATLVWYTEQRDPRPGSGNCHRPGRLATDTVSVDSPIKYDRQ